MIVLRSKVYEIPVIHRSVDVRINSVSVYDIVVLYDYKNSNFVSIILAFVL